MFYDIICRICRHCIESSGPSIDLVGILWLEEVVSLPSPSLVDPGEVEYLLCTA